MNSKVLYKVKEEVILYLVLTISLLTRVLSKVKDVLNLVLIICHFSKALSKVKDVLNLVLMICHFSKVLSKVKEEDVLNLMDELIYKLSVNNDISIAA